MNKKNFFEKLITNDWFFKFVVSCVAVGLLYLIARASTDEARMARQQEAAKRQADKVVEHKPAPPPQPTAPPKVNSVEVEIKVNPDTTVFRRTRPAHNTGIARMSEKDSAAQASKFRILLTGDSMGDGIYLAMLKTKKLNNYVIKYVPWYGSNTSMWGKQKKLENLIADFRPSLVIFTLGSNELFVPGIKSREKYVKELIRQMGDVDYVWVGPPNWKEDTGIGDLIARHVADRYFVSKYMKFERAKDGAHPTMKAFQVWSDTITRWINRRYELNFVDVETMNSMKQLAVKK